VSVSENRVALELARGIGAFLGAIHPGGWREGRAQADRDGGAYDPPSSWSSTLTTCLDARFLEDAGPRTHSRHRSWVRGAVPRGLWDERVAEGYSRRCLVRGVET
jgi:hypothetical protein